MSKNEWDTQTNGGFKAKKGNSESNFSMIDLGV